jgi:hypothetical protein
MNESNLNCHVKATRDELGNTSDLIKKYDMMCLCRRIPGRILMSLPLNSFGFLYVIYRIVQSIILIPEQIKIKNLKTIKLEPHHVV